MDKLIRIKKNAEPGSWSYHWKDHEFSVRTASRCHLLDVEGFCGKDPNECYIVTSGQYQGNVILKSECEDAPPPPPPKVYSYFAVYYAPGQVVPSTTVIEWSSKLTWTKANLIAVQDQINRNGGFLSTSTLISIKELDNSDIE